MYDEIGRRLASIERRLEAQGVVIQRIVDRLDRLSIILSGVRVLLEKESGQMSVLDDEINQLKNDVAGLTSVDASAVALIGGIGAQVQAATSAALAAGATTDQLQSLKDLSATLESSTAALAAAVTANTPVAPAPAAADTTQASGT